MPAKIFDLRSFRSGLRAPNGVVFPQLYRVEGYYFDLDGMERPVPSSRKAETQYALGDTSHHGLANAQWTPLTKLEPALDAGWIVVRHHMQLALVEGYIDALMDTQDTGNPAKTAYKTKEGLFTLLRRAPPPGGPDHLLIYISKVQLHQGPFAGQWIDTYQIVHPDASSTDDFAALTPAGMTS